MKCFNFKLVHSADSTEHPVKFVNVWTNSTTHFVHLEKCGIKLYDEKTKKFTGARELISDGCLTPALSDIEGIPGFLENDRTGSSENFQLTFMKPLGKFKIL